MASAAGSHLLPEFLQSACSRVDLKQWDPTMGWNQPIFALVLHQARAIIRPWGTDFSISESCFAALQPAWEHQERINVVMTPYNLTTHADPVPHPQTQSRSLQAGDVSPAQPASDPAPAEADPSTPQSPDVTIPQTPILPEPQAAHPSPPQVPPASCTLRSGVWLLLADGGHSQDNVFEEGITSWYPSYLVTHYALRGIDPSSVSITHVDGNRKGFLAFQDVYQMYGRYVPWQMVVGAGGDSTPTCVEFETAISINTYWSWLDSPVTAGHNRGLASFANALAHHFSRFSEHPGTCQRRLVFAARARTHRCILNKEEVMAAMVLILPDYEILVVDFSVLSLSKQIQLVRTADIFMFEHGGAGPLVMMQSPGTVSLEVFPYGFADPMYRNMAIMTGKIYLSWQNPDIAKAFGNTNGRHTNSIVDVPALMAVVLSAKHVVNNNAANKFVRTSGEPYDRHLCDWCSKEQQLYACNEGDA